MFICTADGSSHGLIEAWSCALAAGGSLAPICEQLQVVGWDLHGSDFFCQAHPTPVGDRAFLGD